MTTNDDALEAQAARDAEQHDRIAALEAQLAAFREAARDGVEVLDESRSGFIPGCSSDERWNEKKDKIRADLMSALRNMETKDDE